MICSAKLVEAAMRTPGEKLTSSEFLYNLANDDFYWLFNQNLQVFMQYQQLDQTGKEQKARMSLTSLLQLRAHVILIAAEWVPPKPYDFSRHCWTWLRLPYEGFYSLLMPKILLREQSSIVKEMTKDIQRVSPGRNRTMWLR